MEELKLYESEYRFMDLIWEAEPVNSTELVRMAYERLEWKKSTCYTVLKKLADKGFVKNEHAVVTALVRKDEVQKYESEALIEKSFGGSLPAFLNAFLKDRKLTRKEAEEIREMIERALPEAEQARSGADQALPEEEQVRPGADRAAAEFEQVQAEAETAAGITEDNGSGRKGGK